MNDKIATLAEVPDYLMALQMLVDRCTAPEHKKELIVLVGCIEIISRDEGFLMVTANGLETA